MQIRFQTPYQYFFIHEGIKHLFLLWSKEQHRELYIVEEQDGIMYLKFPGEMYRDLLLDQLEHIFFQRLETEDGHFRTALAATFYYGDRLCGAYYPCEEETSRPIEQLYFFEIHEQNIVEIADDDYEQVAETFFKTFPEYIVP